MNSEHDRLLAPSLLEEVDHQPIEEIRALRARCIAAETGLSYLRRMVQGPLDIVSQELARRDRGGGHADLATLLDELPEVLAANTRSAGLGRLPTQLEPTDVDTELAEDLEQIVGNAQLTEIPDMPDDELERLATALADFERRVSERRRAFHGRIDALQAELTRRYRTGEASVESLLH
jgi:hypothetical protein